MNGVQCCVRWILPSCLTAALCNGPSLHVCCSGGYCFVGCSPNSECDLCVRFSSLCCFCMCSLSKELSVADACVILLSVYRTCQRRSSLCLWCTLWPCTLPLVVYICNFVLLLWALLSKLSCFMADCIATAVVVLLWYSFPASAFFGSLCRRKSIGAKRPFCSVNVWQGMTSSLLCFNAWRES